MRARPWVNHDRLDDEVMVIDMESGNYFAFQAAAADIWTLAAAGHSVEDCAAALVARYDVEPGTARADAHSFICRLVERGLLDPDEDDVTTDVNLPTPGSGDGRAAYKTPDVDAYEDLEDLLRMDPIHEVDASGWPAAQAD